DLAKEYLKTVVTQAYIEIDKYNEALVNLNRLLEINFENEEILNIRAQAYTVV
ncbi:20402_t:CDS:2, partial [Gigaspora margarita]